MALRFEQFGPGEWTAYSEVKDEDGLKCSWLINVCDDGTFDVSRSDRPLVGKHKMPCFETFKEAKKWCESREEKLLAEGKVA